VTTIDEPKRDLRVAYCDEHAQVQTNRVPDGLRLELIPIGQAKRRTT
jgi:hypothetical protein